MHASLSRTFRRLARRDFPTAAGQATGQAADQTIGHEDGRRRSGSRRGGLAVRLLAATALSLGAAGAAVAAEPINTLERSGLFGYDPSGIAIRGYDTVAYFTEGRPLEGSERFESEWQGATWRFASQEHLDLFEADPTSYAPQYGGYCAYGVVEGGLVKIEPENWTIVEDKLYLNYDDDVQEKWERDIPGYIAEADARFESLLASE